ncbi:hypothetical protein JEU11_06470 [Paraglaciecola chathamensis]|uniref:Uncharacterized protein n=1 Tax=Paraglaciecola chathamensis TaxID=368405 RepID=A0ABS0WC81_9ALTE|nr:hypothetical protein [Paraglaciecola chathamensis]
MGLILGPLVIFWLVMAIYVVTIGYTLFAALPSHATAVSVSITSLLCLVCYLYWGFSRYKAKTALSWYEIPIAFATHKPSLGVCILAFAVHWVGPNLWVSEYANILTSSIMFAVLFSTSFGVLAGIFGAGTFMKHRGIQQRH